MLDSTNAVFTENDRLSPYLELATTELDEIATLTVGFTHCQPELELFEKKWHEYRFIHPVLATALFTEIYIKTHGEVMLCRGRDDHKSAPFKTGIKRKPIHEQPPATLTGLWKARQTADRYKVPYDFFIRSILLDTEQRGRAYLARPNQMYQAELLENFEQDLVRHLNTGLLFCRDGYFTVEQFEQHPVQLDHIKYVMAQIISKGEAKADLLLASAIYVNQLFTANQAQQFFPESAIKRAERVALKMGFLAVD